MKLKNYIELANPDEFFEKLANRQAVVHTQDTTGSPLKIVTWYLRGGVIGLAITHGLAGTSYCGLACDGKFFTDVYVDLDFRDLSAAVSYVTFGDFTTYYKYDTWTMTFLLMVIDEL